MTVCYSLGEGQFTCQSKTMPSVSSGQFVIGDINGDGKADFIELGVSGNNSLEVCLSLGRGANNSCNSVTPSGFTNYATLTPVNNGTQFLVGDFDGDGLTDFVEFQYGNTSTIFCYSNGDTTFDCETKSIPQATASDGQTSAFVGDFNGDGLTDFGVLANGYGLWSCSSVGRGKNPLCGSTSMPLQSQFGSGELYGPIAIADLNGDGRSDIVTPTSNSSYWQACYSGSDGSMNCTNIPASSGSVILSGNFTGSGASSILTFNPSSAAAALSSISSFYSDLLTSITNGLGAASTITYAPLTNSSTYEKGTGSTFPTMELQNSAFVVSNLQEPDGTGGLRSYEYTYVAARYNQQGRGFLGFARVIKQDVNANREFQMDYHQAYPYIGYASDSYEWIYQGSSWNLASKNQYFYSNETFDTSTRAFPYLSAEVDAQYDFANGGAFVSTVSATSAFDSYGNLTSSTVMTGDGYEKITTNTPTNMLGGPGGIWYLGQLASSQQANTNPDGTNVTRTTQFTYSSSFPNELLSEQIQPGGPDYLTKTYGYDAFGNRTSVSVTGFGMAARNTTIAYDSLGQFPATITNAYSQTETQSYDNRFGLINQLHDVNGLTTTWTVDALGRKVNETRPDGTQTNTAFTVCTSNCNGQTYNVAVSKTGAPTITTYYDVLDREYQRSAGGFNSNTIWQFKSYDTVGRLLTASRSMYITDSYNAASFTYDNGNRIIRETDPDGSTKLWSYTGLSTTTTNNNGQARTELKNELGQVIRITDAANQATQYIYDPFGNLTTTTDPQGHKIAITYDVMGRKIGMSDPDTGTWSYTYDGVGDLLTQTDSKHQTQTMTYDNLGRMVTRQSSEFTGTWSYDTAAHGVGRLASVTNSSGFTKAYTYDSYGRPSTEQTTADTTYTISTAYDSSSRISQIGYPTGFAVNYRYDSNGYLKEIDNASGGSMLWQRNGQNSDNLPLQETFGNGVVSTETYYSATGRLNSVVAMSGNVTLQNLMLSYDYLGNTTNRTDLINQYTGAKQTENYTYDNLNRLRSSSNSFVTKDFSYDGLGNLISKTDVGDMKYGDGSSGRPLHAVMFTNGPTHFAFTYDANGNTTSGEGRTIAWTSFNKPSSVSDASNSVTFSYNPNFERYKEVETTCLDYHGNPTSTCIKYLINPSQSIGVHFEKEINGSITSYRNFIYAGVGNVIGIYTTRSDGSTGMNYFHKDHLGSIVLSTTDNGAVVERMSYDAFGKRRNNLGTDDPNDLLRSITSHQGFTGQEHLDDGGLGLIDMNGRMYDPLIGRFMSPDPYIQNASNLQNLNRYSYVMNNPVSLIDPSGYWFMNDVVSWVSGAASTVGSAIGSAGKWVGNNIGTIAAVAAVVGASVLTFGVADAFLAPALGGIGAALLAGATSGAIAGGLSSSLLGGGFSWKAVGMGALAGAVGGAIGSVAGGLGNSAVAIAGRVSASALGGGLSTWLESVIQGDPSWRSFYQGAAVGAIAGLTTVGLKYLISSGEESAMSTSDSGATPYQATVASNDEWLGFKTNGFRLPFDPAFQNVINSSNICGLATVCTAVAPYFSYVPAEPVVELGCVAGVVACSL
ncbi:MAG: RHS repeat-associated core domain-containing protein [Oligoflexia bacterium]|nr:RHS repeat-associated core domain-containing protein [Oligoflexia bacterium]